MTHIGRYRPSEEEIIALKRFAAKNGRTWKSKLVIAWMNGQDDYEEGGGHLRSVRNNGGPNWLYGYKLPV